MAVTLVCDACSRDLSKTGMMPAFRLHVHAEEVPQPGGTYFVIVSPPFDGELCFCSVKCIASYFQGKLNDKE